ncbi:MAG: TolC family protein [Pirellulales bacterium]|nr:TolC family protein [Pirellulales bacterium]
MRSLVGVLYGCGLVSFCFGQTGASVAPLPPVPDTTLQTPLADVHSTSIETFTAAGQTVIPPVAAVTAATPLPPITPETVAVPTPAPAWNLQDWERLALQNNPSLAEALARVNALRGKWEQVGLPPNPYAGYSSQQTGSGNIAEQRGVIFGQEFVLGHKLQLNRAVASQEVRRAQEFYAAQELRVLTDVRIAYFEVLIARQRQELASTIVTVAESMVRITQQRLEAREIGKTDLLQSTIELASARLLQQRAQNQAIAAWRKLTATAGLPTLPPQPLAGDPAAQIPLLEWNAILGRLLAQSPEIAAAQAEIQRSRWAYQRAMAEKRPNVTFEGTVQDDRAIDGINGAVLVTLPVPLWNKNQGGIVQAGHEALAAERALNTLELDLQQRLAVVFERYDTARVQVERYTRQILPMARENLELIRQAYQAGEFDYMQFLLAQRTYSQTNLEYLSAVQELRTATTEIEGLLLSNSLQATNSR